MALIHPPSVIILLATAGVLTWTQGNQFPTQPQNLAPLIVGSIVSWLCFIVIQFVGSMFNVIIHAGEPCFTTTPLMQPPLYYDQQKLMQSFSYLKPHLTTVCICIQ